MEKFIKSIAYVGHTEGIDIEQMTQVVRRVFKTPQNMDKDFLLNFLLTLAVDNANYAGYDMKSKRFVDECLDFVEEQFAGTIKFNVKVPSLEPEGKPRVIQMFRLKPMESNPSAYNKTLAPKD